jgi:hypothetical protein
VHPLGTGVSEMKALLVTAMLALLPGQAGAVCTTFSPYDPQCSVQDLLGRTQASPQYYIQNPGIRQARIWSCTSGPAWNRPPASWCAAAFAAQRAVNGARVGGGYP